MKILYVGAENDRYDPSQGKSFEYVNFYSTLKNFPNTQIIYRPFDDIAKMGKREFNANLLKTVIKERPDIMFVFMVSDELDTQTLLEIKKCIVSVAWFADDSWRFHNYSRFWARYFTWVVTTYSWAPQLYRKYGQPNVIRSQWGIDQAAYRPVPWTGGGLPPEVSFVGSWSRPRQGIILALKRAGIPVRVYGGGWDGGRIREAQMLEIFSNSKINLGLNPAPGLWNFNSLGRLFMRRSVDKFVPDFHFCRNVKSWLSRGIPQIKARHFEIPACNGFLITSAADDLEKFYQIGEEITVYKDIRELIEKIKYYLAHKNERKRIARAGYERTLREHTYTKRFSEIFRKIGFNDF